MSGSYTPPLFSFFSHTWLKAGHLLLKKGLNINVVFWIIH